MSQSPILKVRWKFLFWIPDQIALICGNWCASGLEIELLIEPCAPLSQCDLKSHPSGQLLPKANFLIRIMLVSAYEGFTEAGVYLQGLQRALPVPLPERPTADFFGMQGSWLYDTCIHKTTHELSSGQTFYFKLPVCIILFLLCWMRMNWDENDFTLWKTSITIFVMPWIF